VLARKPLMRGGTSSLHSFQPHDMRCATFRTEIRMEVRMASVFFHIPTDGGAVHGPHTEALTAPIFASRAQTS
jgi:hypothetical protein